MSNFSKALQSDMDGNYLAAVAEYAKSIQMPEVRPDSFINLSFIYWESVTQGSYSNGQGIVPSLQAMRWDSCISVLKLGLDKYPNDLEMNFWLKYYPYRAVGDSFTEQECELLIFSCINHNNSLVPYFFLSLFQEEAYETKIKELLVDIRKYPTAKNLWIQSILT